MNKFEEIVRNSQKDASNNLKITILNKSAAGEEEEEKMDVIETGIVDEDKLIDPNRGHHSGDDDDDTEFHVNLDKAPPTLQNTILNEKIYLNEANGHTDATPPFDLDFISEPNLSLLYDSLNLTESNFAKDPQPDLKSTNLYRKDSIHVYGVDLLTTEDIFDFFSAYKPFAIEWINDSSCNVAWKNETHAANALLHISQPYECAAKRERLPPQGNKWRKATQLAKGKYQLYMRFVRLSTDRKIKGAESRSKFYVRHGNPNYGNIKGLISESKRKELKTSQLKEASNGLDLEIEANGRKLVSYEDVAEEFGVQREPLKAESRRARGLYSDQIEQSRKKSRFEPYSRHDRSSAKSTAASDPSDLRNKLNRIKGLSSQ
ncbi:Nuclear cap-binding subunit 3 [Brachionus plicatilis]|uniref:Nuclear cap-binding protein subunit 3 n=1 Tax=Brachionus plicatilis TaxID=10195 RepID=A0A3M7PMY3_BRAPC|nr:Nuclear cap-binding subunit 3 [Brachionus plicatilis]